jgi:hypothetical protein
MPAFDRLQGSTNSSAAADAPNRSLHLLHLLLLLLWPPLSVVLFLQVEALNVLIIVERFSTRWVLSALFRIMATTWLGFLVFLLPRDDMGGRLGNQLATLH